MRKPCRQVAWHTWLIYLAPVTGLSLTPGPNGLLALMHGAIHGHRKALHTVLGGVTGFVLLIALSMSGIGAVLQSTPQALTVLRWGGAAYLLCLGMQLRRAPAMRLAEGDDTPDSHGRTLFLQGLISDISNPKVLLFFGAFLSQFIDQQRALLPQFFVMAATFALTEFAVEYLLARFAFHVCPWLERAGTLFNRSCGGLFILIGAVLPLAR